MVMGDSTETTDTGDGGTEEQEPKEQQSEEEFRKEFPNQMLIRTGLSGKKACAYCRFGANDGGRGYPPAKWGVEHFGHVLVKGSSMAVRCPLLRDVESGKETRPEYVRFAKEVRRRVVKSKQNEETRTKNKDLPSIIPMNCMLHDINTLFKYY